MAILPGANVSPHYLFITYPSQFLLLAFFLIKAPLHRYLRSSLIAMIILAYVVYSIFFYVAVIDKGGTDGIYGIPLKSKIDVLTYAHDALPNSTLLFYDYVKPEYRYLQPYYAYDITFDVIDHFTTNMTGYILLDFYSRGNFAEQNMTLEEREFYQSLPFTSIGQITLISLDDYKTALAHD